MSDRLHEVAQHIADHGLDADSWFTLREVATESLKDTDSPRIIRTISELEALAREDADAVVLGGLIGVPRPACTLYEMYREYQTWTLPAVVIATGAQVRAAREAMEKENE